MDGAAVNLVHELVNSSNNQIQLIMDIDPAMLTYEDPVSSSVIEERLGSLEKRFVAQ